MELQDYINNLPSDIQKFWLSAIETAEIQEQPMEIVRRIGGTIMIDVAPDSKIAPQVRLRFVYKKSDKDSK